MGVGSLHPLRKRRTGKKKTKKKKGEGKHNNVRILVFNLINLKMWQDQVGHLYYNYNLNWVKIFLKAHFLPGIKQRHQMC